MVSFALGLNDGSLVGLEDSEMDGAEVGEVVGIDVGETVGELVGIELGSLVGLEDGSLVSFALGLNDGSLIGIVDGELVSITLGVNEGSLVGLEDGEDEGGSVLGLHMLGDSVGEDNASSQERQHIRETESREHLVSAFFRTAQSQVLLIPNSGISNFSVPAASPTQEEQQLPQQFNATSLYEHRTSLSSGTLIAQSHDCLFLIPKIENLSVVESPLQSDGHGDVVGDIVGSGDT